MLDQRLILACVALFVLFTIGWLVYQKRKTDYSWVQFSFWVIANCLTRFLWRTTYANPLPEDAHRGVIFVCNHGSGIDPFFLQVLCKRPIRWMVAKEYCEHRIFGWFLRHCEVISVSRGGIDTSATKAAIRCAQQGGMLGMFPEGRLNMTEELLLPVRPGAVVVALRTGTPLLPCYIDGAPTRGTAMSSFFMRARVRVSFGEMIDVSEYQEMEQSDQLVVEIMTRVVLDIAKLAGREDYVPQFAGRKWKPSEEEVRVHREEKLRREMPREG
jgi:1-acyl-sn-glycerol-3-phosphate acyltransferase